MNRESIENQIRLWMPIRTKPRQEKKLARYCLSHGLSYYLPLSYKEHYYEKRKVTFSQPLLPGYLFSRINEQDFFILVRSNAVAYRIKTDINMECDLKKELHALRIFERLSISNTIEVRPELTKGTVVRINKGPMQGTSGIIEARKNQMILIVNIGILGHSVATEINADDLEKD